MHAMLLLWCAAMMCAPPAPPCSPQATHRIALGHARGQREPVLARRDQVDDVGHAQAHIGAHAAAKAGKGMRQRAVRRPTAVAQRVACSAGWLRRPSAPRLILESRSKWDLGLDLLVNLPADDAKGPHVRRLGQQAIRHQLWRGGGVWCSRRSVQPNSSYNRAVNAPT